MKFLKSNVKFICIFFLLAFISIEIIELQRTIKKNDDWMSRRIESIHRMADANYQSLKERIDFLGQTVIDEHNITRATDYITYAEIVKGMNHHAGYKNDPSEILEYKSILNAFKRDRESNERKS